MDEENDTERTTVSELGLCKEEVRTAMRKMKTGKADDITMKVLRCPGERSMNL